MKKNVRKMEPEYKDHYNREPTKINADLKHKFNFCFSPCWFATKYKAVNLY